MIPRTTKILIYQKKNETHNKLIKSVFERSDASLYLNVLMVLDEKGRTILRINNNRIKLRQEKKKQKLPEFMDPGQITEMKQGIDEELK